MKALITGGAGFVGYHLANKLVEKGMTVHLLDNFARGVSDTHLEKLLEYPNVEMRKADLLKDELSEKVDSDYDYIYHLAAIIGVQHVMERPLEVLILNNNMLEKVIRHAKGITNLKRFIFASTSEIYAGTLKKGNLELPTPETSPLIVPDLEEKRTSYMLSKIYGEAICNQSGVPFTIIRPHNFYGPRMGLVHVVPEMCKKIYKDKMKSMEVHSPDHTRTFCYIEDAIEVITRLAEAEGGLNQAFNIGASQPEVKIMELAETIKKVVGSPVILERGHEHPGSPARRCPQISKSVRVTDFEPHVSLDEGIRRTFDWYKENIFDNDGVSAQ